MMSRPVCESSWPVGSSASRRRGRLARARAIATRCCSPPISCGRWSVRPSPTSSSSSATRASRARIGGHEPQRDLDVLRGGQDRQQAERLEDEPDRPPPERDQLALGHLRHRKTRDVDTLVGWSRVPIRESSVVLPEPDRPRMATSSPGSTRNVMPSTARIVALPV